MKNNANTTDNQKDLETVKRFKDFNLIDSDVSEDLEESLKELYKKRCLNTRKKFYQMLENLPNKVEVIENGYKTIQNKLEIQN